MLQKDGFLTEFVGTAIGDTLGLVIARVDTSLQQRLKLPAGCGSIGIISARTGQDLKLWPLTRQ